MDIKYENEKLTNKYNDEHWLTREFSKTIANHFADFLKKVTLSTNIQELAKKYSGLKIEKLRKSNKEKKIYSARLNCSYRVEFYISTRNEIILQEINSITISKIHNHKY